MSFRNDMPDPDLPGKSYGIRILPLRGGIRPGGDGNDGFLKNISGNPKQQRTVNAPGIGNGNPSHFPEDFFQTGIAFNL
jgi:hypothetical protein